MKLVNKRPKNTADISSSKGKDFSELFKLTLIVSVLCFVVYLLIGLIVNLVVMNISVKTEGRIFSNIPTKMFNTVKDERLADVQEIFDKLINDSQVPDLPYKLVAIKEKAPNALAFPGGSIGVTKGLLDKLGDDEIAMAFVLGHELGHYYNRDHLKGIGRAVGAGIVFAVIFGGEGGDASFGNMFQYVIHRKYSRKQEALADRFGIELVHRIYGKTEGSDYLFKILLEETKMPEWAYMFKTHPAFQKRIADLKKIEEELKGKIE